MFEKSSAVIRTIRCKAVLLLCSLLACTPLFSDERKPRKLRGQASLLTWASIKEA